MISNKQKFSLIYFITNSFFLASSYSLIFKTCGKDSWLAMIIGTFFGICIIYVMKKHLKNNNLENENIICKAASYIFHLFILFINILVARIFATSFFLTKTPGFLITLPFIMLSFINAKKGINNILKVSEILMPISLFFITISIIAVLKDTSVSAFLPLLSASKKSILLASFYYAIFTSIPHLMLVNLNIGVKDHIKSYLYSSIVSIIIGILIIAILGPYLIKIFRFPEYMVLKQIKIFNFIEKIENLVGLIWFFDLFISSSICFYNINKINNNNKYISYITIATLVLFTEHASKNYEYANYIYKHLPVLLLGAGLIYIILHHLFKKNKKSS